jgi:cytochrome d ubiquinol oxidase subunit II
VGNAAGHLFSSWLNPTSILVGALTVVFSAYLAAVYLAADAVRVGERSLQDAFRARALGAGVATGAIALGGLIVLHGDAHSLFEGLVHGAALAVLIVSVLAGGATLALVSSRRFAAARYSAALAVAAVVAGWAFARYPVLLPGLTVRQAAAPHDTLVTLVVAVIAGGVILFPSLGLLFSLTLGGRFDPHGPPGEPSAETPTLKAMMAGPAPGARVAVALLIAGIGLLNVASAAWAHAIGVTCLFAFMVLVFALIVPRAVEGDA